MLYKNLSVNEYGHLCIGGMDAVGLAEKYGTPLYVLDENVIRANCRKYVEAMHRHFGSDATPLYASKALSFKGIYPIIEEEGLCIDVVSSGEIYTALAVGFPAEKMFFHGTNKTDEDIRYALENGVGYFVVDNLNELEALEQIIDEFALGNRNGNNDSDSSTDSNSNWDRGNNSNSSSNNPAVAAGVRLEKAAKGGRGFRQKVLLRLTVGLDPHTLEAINTGRVDSQFGVPIDTGQADDFVRSALECENIEIMGFHSHVGSQIFESDSFIRQIEKLVEYAAKVRDEMGFTARAFNIGGGFGVRYVEDDPIIDVDARIAEIAACLRVSCERFGYWISDSEFAKTNEIDWKADDESRTIVKKIPVIYMEPGRSIVADAGITLYTAGGVKEVKGYRNYVTVDGGMADNPRFALYGSRYTIVNASRAGDPADYPCTVAGRACESGDRIAEDVKIARPCRGDVIAVLGTGAYNYSMASNYNRLPRPAMVMISAAASETAAGTGAAPESASDRLVIQRESFADLIKNEL